MTSFKDFISSDLEVFINSTDFAEEITINNKPISVVIDNDRLKYRSKVEYEGIAVGDILYFAKLSDFARKPLTNDVQDFNGTLCVVFDVREDMGIFEIILKRTVAHGG